MTTTSPRVALITGASQGIGEGLVSGYRKLGYAVVANSRSITRLRRPDGARRTGRPRPSRGVGDRVVDAALAQFGRIDTVVNNAGIFISKPFTEYTDDDYDAITGLNLRGFFEVTRAALAAMVAADHGGHVVTISTSLVDHANAAGALGVGVADQGRAQRRHQGAGNRIRGQGNSCQRRRTRRGEDTHARPGAPTRRWPRCIRWAGWATSPTSSTPCSTSSRPPFVTGEILHVDGGQSAGH